MYPQSKKLIKDNAMDKKGAFGMHNKIKRTIRNLRIMYTLKRKIKNNDMDKKGAFVMHNKI